MRYVLLAFHPRNKYPIGLTDSCLYDLIPLMRDRLELELISIAQEIFPDDPKVAGTAVTLTGRSVRGLYIAGKPVTTNLGRNLRRHPFNRQTQFFQQAVEKIIPDHKTAAEPLAEFLSMINAQTIPALERGSAEVTDSSLQPLIDQHLQRRHYGSGILLRLESTNNWSRYCLGIAGNVIYPQWRVEEDTEGSLYLLFQSFHGRSKPRQQLGKTLQAVYKVSPMVLALTTEDKEGEETYDLLRLQMRLDTAQTLIRCGEWLVAEGLMSKYSYFKEDNPWLPLVEIMNQGFWPMGPFIDVDRLNVTRFAVCALKTADPTRE